MVLSFPSWQIENGMWIISRAAGRWRLDIRQGTQCIPLCTALAIVNIFYPGTSRSHHPQDAPGDWVCVCVCVCTHIMCQIRGDISRDTLLCELPGINPCSVCAQISAIVIRRLRRFRIENRMGTTTHQFTHHSEQFGRNDQTFISRRFFFVFNSTRSLSGNFSLSPISELG